MILLPMSMDEEIGIGQQLGVHISCGTMRHSSPNSQDSILSFADFKYALVSRTEKLRCGAIIQGLYTIITWLLTSKINFAA